MDETRREPAVSGAAETPVAEPPETGPRDEAQARLEAKRASAVRREKLARRRAAQRKASHNVLLGALLLLTILVVAVVNLAVKDRSFSEAENRNLAQKPGFSWTALADGSWFSGLTDWYSDQFFGRDRWISMHLWETRRLGQKESGGVWLGKDGYLLSSAEEPDTEALARTAETMNRFALEHPELRQWLLLAPNAASILTDELPKNAPSRDQLPDILSAEAQISVEALDAAQPLRNHADEEIYYHTDHHWTSLGAKYVFDSVAGAMGLDPSGVSYDTYTVTGSFEGTLASKSGSHGVKDHIEIYSPTAETIQYYVIYDGDGEKITSIYQSSALDQKDQYTVFFGGNHALVEIQTTANNGRTLLLFKDSYANCFVQFLLPHYEKIVMVDPRYFYDSLDTILNSGVTDVLYLYSADTFLADTSLADVLETAGPTQTEPVTEPVPAGGDIQARDTEGKVPEAEAAEDAGDSGETDPAAEPEGEDDPTGEPGDETGYDDTVDDTVDDTYYG